MKKLLVIFSLLVTIGAFAQAPSDIVFKTTSHQFGKVKQKVPATYVFSFTNNSAKPVVIEFANADCGCTKPSYSDAPILKGQTSKITVTYNAENLGTFKKNVNVKFLNQTLPITLTIQGEVVAVAKSKAK
ncbi:MAG: DUF1573 domain-containing protein [Sediminibacterium sp.]